MKPILEIYKEYNIISRLRDHQLRVAGVAGFICDHLQEPVNKEEIVTACLLHDMGNILKFNLDAELFPGQFEPQGKEYWVGIKNQYREKYGQDEHHASIMIAKELGVSARVAELIGCIGFVQGKGNAETDNMDQKICAYADMRVSPWGVVTLQERFDDLRKRYGQKRHDGKQDAVPSEEVLLFEKALINIEQQIFARCSIGAVDITNESVAGLVSAVQ
jgi:hypothetical protein